MQVAAFGAEPGAFEQNGGNGTAHRNAAHHTGGKGDGGGAVQSESQRNQQGQAGRASEPRNEAEKHAESHSKEKVDNVLEHEQAFEARHPNLKNHHFFRLNSFIPASGGRQFLIHSIDPSGGTVGNVVAGEQRFSAKFTR